MKKGTMFAIMGLTLILSLIFAVPALASNAQPHDLQVEFGEFVFGELAPSDEDFTSARQPAIPVTGVWPHRIMVLPNGNVQLEMLVAGQGSFINHWSTLGPSRLVRIDFAAGIAPVTHFIHVFDLGPARVGTHWFDFTLRCLRTGNMGSNWVQFTIQ